MRKIASLPFIHRELSRDGSLQDFEPDKIRIAISKAFSATGFEDPEASKGLSGIIISGIEQKFPNAIPHVEEIQDITWSMS